MTSSPFYSVLVTNGPPGWGRDRNHGVSGTGIGQPSRERAQRLICQEAHWDSQALSLPVAIYSEKHKMHPHQLILSFAPNQ